MENDNLSIDRILKRMNASNYNETECIRVCNHINNFNDKIKDIDNQIIELLNQRKSLLRHNYKQIRTVTCCSYLFGVQAFIIYDEFKKFHFDSKIVQTAVAKVRQLLFDDKIEAYQHFNCVDCQENYLYSEGGLIFIFKDNYSNAEFSVQIPDTCCMSNDDVQQYAIYGGQISIHYYLDKYIRTCLCSSYIVSEIKDKLKEIILFVYEGYYLNNKDIKDKFINKFYTEILEKIRNPPKKIDSLTDLMSKAMGDRVIY